MTRGGLQRGGSQALGLTLCGFAVVFFGRAWLVRGFGSPVPFWDQWGAEALRLYLPWNDGTLVWSSLWAPHNEHRLVLTHLQNLALFVANGRWDPILQMVANAAWNALIAAFLAGMFLDRGTRGSGRIAAGFTVLVFALPFGWQNALWGFQSQFYLALLAWILTFAGLCRCPAGSAGWYGGAAAGIAGLFANAAGGISACAILAVLGARCALAPSSRRDAVPGMAVAVLLLAGSMAVAAPAANQLYLHAGSFAVFGRALASGLAWPAIDQPWLAPLMWLPCLVLGARLARRTVPFGRTEALILYLGIVAAAEAAAVAYARGQGLPDGQPLSRYQDALALGAIANLAALLNPGDRGPGPAWRILRLVWIASFALGIGRLTYANATVHLPFLRRSTQLQLQNLREYQRTRDPAVFAGKSLYQIGHTDPLTLRRVLDDPRSRRILPASLQENEPAPTFLESAVRGLLAVSPAALAVAAALFAFLLLRRPAGPEPPAEAPRRGTAG